MVRIEFDLRQKEGQQLIDVWGYSNQSLEDAKQIAVDFCAYIKYYTGCFESERFERADRAEPKENEFVYQTGFFAKVRWGTAESLELDLKQLKNHFRKNYKLTDYRGIEKQLVLQFKRTETNRIYAIRGGVEYGIDYAKYENRWFIELSDFLTKYQISTERLLTFPTLKEAKELCVAIALGKVSLFSLHRQLEAARKDYAKQTLQTLTSALQNRAISGRDLAEWIRQFQTLPARYQNQILSS